MAVALTRTIASRGLRILGSGAQPTLTEPAPHQLTARMAISVQTSQKMGFSISPADRFRLSAAALRLTCRRGFDADFQKLLQPLQRPAQLAMDANAKPL